MKNTKIDANGTEIRVMGDIVNEDAYISLTDIAKYKIQTLLLSLLRGFPQNLSFILLRTISGKRIPDNTNIISSGNGIYIRIRSRYS